LNIPVLFLSQRIMNIYGLISSILLERQAVYRIILFFKPSDKIFFANTGENLQLFLKIIVLF